MATVFQCSADDRAVSYGQQLVDRVGGEAAADEKRRRQTPVGPSRGDPFEGVCVDRRTGPSAADDHAVGQPSLDEIGELVADRALGSERRV